MGTSPRDIDCAALRHERGPAKLFAFPSAGNSRSGLTPPPTDSEKEIKSLPSSNNTGSLKTAINVWNNCTIADD